MPSRTSTQTHTHAHNARDTRRDKTLGRMHARYAYKLEQSTQQYGNSDKDFPIRMKLDKTHFN